MLVMPADKKFDSTKAKLVQHMKDLRYASEEEVAAIAEGVKPGRVPPFGNLFGLQVATNPSLFNKRFIFNAGRNCSSYEICRL